MKYTLCVDAPYQKNEIFNPASALNRDDYLYSFRQLKEEFEKRGHSLNTQDITPIASADGVLYIDYPKNFKVRSHSSFLILQESEVVRPDNYELSKHLGFKKVFTWKDSLVDGTKYFKLNFCHRILQPINQVPFQKKRMIVCVSGNKSSSHPKELYSARRRAIVELEREVGGDFAYYGPGWERFYLSNTKILKVFRKFKIEKFLPLHSTPSYEGLLKEKRSGMNQFKFCLCYENARDIPGYITEKIFDCFFASVIPVYWGAPDIDKHIPSDSYIDFRKFQSISALVSELRKMDEMTFNQYLDSARKFLNSPQAQVFSGEHFARTVVDQVVNS